MAALSLPGSSGSARWHFQRVWGHSRPRCHRHRPLAIREPGGATIPAAKFPPPSPLAPREPPDPAGLFKENDESVFKQREPVFTRVFSRKTNRKSGGSGSSARAICRLRRGRQIPGGTAGVPAPGARQVILGDNEAFSGGSSSPAAPSRKGGGQTAANRWIWGFWNIKAAFSERGVGLKREFTRGGTSVFLGQSQSVCCHPPKNSLLQEPFGNLFPALFWVTPGPFRALSGQEAPSSLAVPQLSSCRAVPWIHPDLARARPRNTRKGEMLSDNPHQP